MPVKEKGEASSMDTADRPRETRTEDWTRQCEAGGEGKA